MNTLANLIGLILFVIGIYVALPVVTVWGWLRWAKSKHQPTLPSLMSLIGFTLATASGLLAISAFLYAYHTYPIEGFPFYDPLLITICRWGILLSFVGIVSAICGVWRRNDLRWRALVSTVGSLLFWLAVAVGE